MSDPQAIQNLHDWLIHLNWVDYSFCIILIYSIVTGFWVGFMAQCVALTGVMTATFLAGRGYEGVGAVLGLCGIALETREWVGFAAVFITVMLVFHLAALGVYTFSKRIVSGWPNRIAGGLIGVIVGAMICYFIEVTVLYFHIGDMQDALLQSKIATSSTSWLKEFLLLLPHKMQHILELISDQIHPYASNP